LAGFGAHIDPEDLVSDLPQADKTLVAIARGLDAGDVSRKVLVLDEPTAALPFDEVEALFAALKKLAAQGVGLIYVSHRLSEVLSLADYVTALRDGQVVATAPTSELDERKLVNMIIGRSLETFYPKMAGAARDEAVLEVKGLSGTRLKGIDFVVRRGEILGVAGLLGSGRSELGRLIFGSQIKKAGNIRFEGRDIEVTTPSEALACGIGYVPEDRLGKGGIGTMTVAENLTLPDLSAVWRGGYLRRRDERRLAKEIIQRFRIRPNDPDARFSSLSGGNQQKTIIARALRLEPRLLILDEPVQGVDIGSKVEIYELIEEVAKEGTAMIVIDADFTDLCRLCDRILVLHEGNCVGELAGNDRTRERIAELVHSSGKFM
jgi:ABC-type sugar transport system ATPase subunit